MKYILRAVIYRYKFVLYLINKYYRIRYGEEYDTIVKQRSSLSIFDYHKLVEPVPYPANEYVIDNNLYGLAYWLKKYAGLSTSKSSNSYIEHGLFFGSLVRPEEWQYYTPNIVTYGDTRHQHIICRNIEKKITMVGPFVHYAEPYLSSKDFDRLKEKLGRVLLIFPSHSIKQVKSEYNSDSFIDFIEGIRPNYDSVLVSLYWLDVLRPDIVSIYERRGYLIVTNGHRYDYNFLSRQRSIIELADYTVSNSIGSHLGYCIYLKKPHTVFKQEIKFTSKVKKDLDLYKKVRNDQELLTEQIEKEEIYSFFSKYQNEITKEQYEIANKYWGFSHIKTPQELRNVL